MHFSSAVEFEWDDAKSESNFRKHGLDFELASKVFDGRPNQTIRSGYTDEVRFVTTGIIEARTFSVVWTRRGNRIRVISARRARDAEERAYRALYQ
ncbi:MAG: BrnT family toxin [Thermomicrobiales bacterium]